MENRTIRLSEKIILRGPHPPPSPEERGPILQTEKFALFEAAYSWKTIFFILRERPPLLWRGARGEARLEWVGV